MNELMELRVDKSLTEFNRHDSWTGSYIIIPIHSQFEVINTGNC